MAIYKANSVVANAIKYDGTYPKIANLFLHQSNGSNWLAYPNDYKWNSNFVPSTTKLGVDALSLNYTGYTMLDYITMPNTNLPILDFKIQSGVQLVSNRYLSTQILETQGLQVFMTRATQSYSGYTPGVRYHLNNFYNKINTKSAHFGNWDTTSTYVGDDFVMKSPSFTRPSGSGGSDRCMPTWYAIVALSKNKSSAGTFNLLAPRRLIKSSNSSSSPTASFSEYVDYDRVYYKRICGDTDVTLPGFKTEFYLIVCYGPVVSCSTSTYIHAFAPLYNFGLTGSWANGNECVMFITDTKCLCTFVDSIRSSH